MEVSVTLARDGDTGIPGPVLEQDVEVVVVERTTPSPHVKSTFTVQT